MSFGDDMHHHYEINKLLLDNFGEDLSEEK